MADDESRLLMLIDDDPARCRAITSRTARDGWRTVTVRDEEMAIATLGTRQGMQLRAIILEAAVAPDEITRMIRDLHDRRPALPIIVISDDASPTVAVQIMRAGATDYLIHPFPSERLVEALRSATRRGAPAPALQLLTHKLTGRAGFDGLIGTAPGFRAALAVAAKAARSNTSVLIEGEGGTGKEALIRAIHSASSRAKQPLQAVNLAAVPAHSHQSLLFGHEQGAFPGAFTRQHGALHHADGGILVLDEIDRLDPLAQQSLADALARGEVRPIGARHSFKIDVRVIAASNVPLDDLVKSNAFSPELYGLIAATRIVLPPLRDRIGDVPALVRHFLSEIGQQPGLRPLGITEQALSLLSSYDWPGNVRQLQATLFRASVFCDGDTLTEEDFPDLGRLAARPATSPTPEGVGIQLYTADGHLRPLEDIEADVIRLAIGHYRGRMSEVARRLGIGRSTLYRKLGELGIDNVA